MLKLLQCNLQKSRAVTGDFISVMTERNIDVAIVQEPSANEHMAIGFRGMKTFSSPDLKASIIVNSPDVVSMQVILDDMDKGVCAFIGTKDFGIHMVSIYCRFGEDIGVYLDYLDRLISCIGDKPMIVGMDANAVSSYWHSKNMRRGDPATHRGFELTEFLINKDLTVLNQPSELYTFDGPAGTSDIDVTCINEAASEYAYDWSIMEGVGISDHSVIGISIGYPVVNHMDEITCRWSTYKVDWTEYANSINECANDLPFEDYEEMTIDDKAEWLERLFHQVNDVQLKRLSGPRLKRVKWWTPELSNRRRITRKRRVHFQHARRNGAADLQQVKAAFLSSQRLYKKLIRKSKDDDWKDFVSRYADDPWGSVYRICRDKKRNAQISALKVGDTVTVSWEESVDVLMNAFFPASPIDLVVADVRLEETSRVRNSETEASVMATRSRKSPGPDGITGAMFKCAWKFLDQHIVCLFNQCVLEGHFPAVWKVAELVVLLKSRDKVMSNPKS